MHLRALVLALSLPAAAFAQSGAFDIQANGKSIGRATYTLSPNKGGFKLASRYGYHLNGSEADQADDFKFDANYAYQSGSISDIASQAHISYSPNKARTTLTIGVIQAGVQDSSNLAIKPDLAFLPPYDPGGAQALLLLATTHPTASNLYNVFVPKLGSSGGGPKAGGDSDPGQPGEGRSAGGNRAYDALWTKGEDATGTLDGKPVGLHTYKLTAGASTWTFFADDTNTLMQLDNSMLHASYIRAKFKLDSAK